jgi:hemerythrin-like metal-binding protein
MENNMVVQWQNSYSVGIKPIDEQHMELINLTNKLFRSCMSGHERSNSMFLDTIHEAVEYTGYHFGTEERMMERIHYPDYAKHKQEHTDFVREVYIKVEEFKSGKMLTSLHFVYFLRDWVLHHIAVCDKKLGEYLLYLRQSGELQKMTVRVKKDTVANRVLIK